MMTLTLYTITHKYGTDLLTREGVIEYVHHWEGTLPYKLPSNLRGWNRVLEYFNAQAAYDLGEYLDEYTIVVDSLTVEGDTITLNMAE